MLAARLALSLLVAAPLLGAAANPAWRVGTDLSERLGEPVDVNWSGAPLRAALYGLGRSKEVAILLDRRVDPDQRLDVVLHDLSLGAALAQIASRQNAGVSRTGTVVYIGPPASAARLRPLAELRRREALALPRPLRDRLLAERPLGWHDLAEPRQLLAGLASEAGLQPAGLEQLPHDLWAAADLPAMPLVERITLVANQFDLTFVIDQRQRVLRLVPVPAGLIPDRPDRALETRRPAPRPADEEKRFTLRQAKGQLSDLLPKLARMLGVELRIDQAALDRAGIVLDQAVTLSVEDATADELFAKLLEPAGCTFRREGHTLVVVPKP